MLRIRGRGVVHGGALCYAAAEGRSLLKHIWVTTAEEGSVERVHFG